MFLLPNSFFCIKKKAQQPICLKTNAELSYIIAHLSLTSTKSLAISICAQTRHKLTFDRPTMTTEQDNIRPVILLLHLSCTEDYVHTNPGQVTCFFQEVIRESKIPSHFGTQVNGQFVLQNNPTKSFDSDIPQLTASRQHLQ